MVKMVEFHISTGGTRADPQSIAAGGSSTATTAAIRKRKTHSKSRQGCSNCKLRRVKCDEAKPGCRKCEDYGVRCSYGRKPGSRGAEGQLAFGEEQMSFGEQISLVVPPLKTTVKKSSSSDGSRASGSPPSDEDPSIEANRGPLPLAIAASVGPLPLHTAVAKGASLTAGPPIQALEPSLTRPPSMSRSILGIMNSQLNESMDLSGNAVYNMGMEDLQTIGRFLGRTLASVGTKPVRDAYQAEGFRLACSNPYLMHIILALTMSHDRHLAPGPLPKPTIAELKHSTTGLQLFNLKLLKPLTSSEKDAIWITGAFLGLYSISSFDGNSPYDAWPLQPSDYDDLTWLRLSEGKSRIYELVDLSRPDSCLRGAFQSFKHPFQDDMTDREAINRLGPEMVSFLGLQEGQGLFDEHQSPYWQLAAIMGRLMDVDCNVDTAMKYLTFLSRMTKQFIGMAERKDPRALMLICWWSAKISVFGEWWVFRRTYFECQAICIWFKLYHPDVPNLATMLAFPISIVGPLEGPPAGWRVPLPSQSYDKTPVSSMDVFATPGWQGTQRWKDAIPSLGNNF